LLISLASIELADVRRDKVGELQDALHRATITRAVEEADPSNASARGQLMRRAMRVARRRLH
jgi:hypothetical protein